MTTFGNLGKSASVTSEANGYTLTGEVQYSGQDNRIISFCGTVGDCPFLYNEQENGNVNYSVTAPTTMRRTIEDIVFAAAADIHTEFDIVNE